MNIKVLFSMFLLLSNFLFAEVNQKDPVKIAALIHLTGEYAQFGNAFREGIILATEKVNQEGGIKGQKLEIILQDTQYVMKTVNTLAIKAISLDKVILGLISNYTEVMVAGSVFERAKTPLITLWDAAPEIENLGDYVFGIGIWSPSTSQAAVDYVVDKKNAKTAVTLATNGQWSLAVADNFAKQFKKAGGKILNEIQVNPTETDFRTIVAKIAHLKPDVLYAPLSDNPVAFWKQLHSSGFKGIRITSDTLNEDLVAELGVISDGIFQTQISDPETNATKQMLKEYKSKFGKDCKQIFLTALGYDGVLLAAQAMRQADVLNPQEINKQLYKIKNYPGAAGLTSIDEKGTAKKKSKVFVIKDGKFHLADNSLEARAR